MTPIPVYVGFDGKVEPVAYHAFCQSVIERSTVPVAFVPLALNLLERVGYRQQDNRDGSNAFIYSRFLVPFLNGYQGLALFVDGDMLLQADLAELLALADSTKAVQVVQHDYRTRHPVKYLGQKNEDYPRKNWSSVILWNCGHEANRQLTPQRVMSESGKFLHRFAWLNADEIGALPPAWNWLEHEYPANPEAKLIHYTLGTPCFRDYQQSDTAEHWHDTYQRMIYPLRGFGRDSHL